MSPLFMETNCEPTSPGSGSDEGHSERETEGHVLGERGTKRRLKNRDAARKSRKKQTERADELHQELEQLEQSNSALQKEIRALKKDVHHYTTVLERHEPFCRLMMSNVSASSTVSPGPSTASSLGPQSVDLSEGTCLSPSALFSSSLFTPAPHSLFCQSSSTPAKDEIENLFHTEFQGLPASSTLLPDDILASPPFPADTLGAPLVDPHGFTGNPNNSDSQRPPISAQTSRDVTLEPSEELMSAPDPLLSLIPIPSSSGNLQAPSSTQDGPFQPNASSLAMIEERPGELSLFDLLKDNEWILSAETRDQ
uniref:basic leucine zipper transcriptional factor ATF-like 2 n=1 Tax=Doryrhamphus excisus TaxID=161450 RepID=UPI0025AE1190|nr:basic leucine zipper transcriptional factor ATF-like 2 [Doryrhamphus excisus]